MITLDLVQTALLFSGLGAGAAKLVELGITRLNAKDSNTITLTTHMSDQSKLLFDQLSVTIKDQTATIKDITKERNDLQLRVFELMPEATKMLEFEKELTSRNLTYDDCILIIREVLGELTDTPGRRWYERTKLAEAKTPQPDVGPG